MRLGTDTQSSREPFLRAEVVVVARFKVYLPSGHAPHRYVSCNSPKDAFSGFRVDAIKALGFRLDIELER
jgi:hypothetical protein